MLDRPRPRIRGRDIEVRAPAPAHARAPGTPWCRLKDQAGRHGAAEGSSTSGAAVAVRYNHFFDIGDRIYLVAPDRPLREQKQRPPPGDPRVRVRGTAPFRGAMACPSWTLGAGRSGGAPPLGAAVEFGPTA